MIDLDDDTYVRVEKEAQRTHKSVPDFAKFALITAASGGPSQTSAEEFLRLEVKEAEITSRITDFRSSDRLSRDEIYDRKRD